MVYDNPAMEELGLTGLTKILRGGVKIVRNKNLCYVNTIDWSKITPSDYHEHNMIEVILQLENF